MATSVLLKQTSRPLETNDLFPKAFVASLKVLFDILDEDGSGLVHVNEIEKRWASEGGSSGLPFGVLNGLRKAAPKNGKLSFDRFCSGIKLSLNNERGVGKGREDRHPNMATVRPNNVVRPMAVRARSAPELPRGQNGRPRSLSSNNMDPSRNWELAVQKAKYSEDKLYPKHRVKGETKPQRRSAPPGDINSNDPFHPRIQKDSHRPARRSDGDYERYQPRHPLPASAPVNGHGRMGSHPQRKSQGALYVHPSSPVEGKRVESSSSHPERRSPGHSPKPRPETKERTKREDPRRHTVTNGIDYNLLKRMKQLEQERDVLLQGLEVADRAKDWYQRQLAYVRQRQPGYSGNSQFTHGEDTLSSGQQDRLAYRVARILEINKQLTHLMENPEKDFPDHMNLAMSKFQPSQSAPTKLRPSSTSSSGSGNDKLVAKLRDQNRLLTKEVSQKSELITQLEKDKAALIRQLFESRGKKPISEIANNTTFI
ncbi:suppressor APC domain-containing protein 2-like [Asterias rubens]|uniref:suppressor APC domain-containing protein 2-like n=1 Tax=Asterias rubens TaxID=7604 RepID=UPI001455A58A|nr:suppressor APC domain-containing protein 2-like [Asterias rubens]